MKRERDSKRPGKRQLGSSTEMPKQPTERTEVMAPCVSLPFLSLSLSVCVSRLRYLTLNGFSLSLSYQRTTQFQVRLFSLSLSFSPIPHEIFRPL